MRTLGWDVGGAHLKAVLAEGHRILKVWQLPTPIWQGLTVLEEALDTIAAAAGPVDRHGVTMTGELSDIFASRREGVERLSQLLATRLPGEIALYAGAGGFVTPAEAGAQNAVIASANWHASATLAAEELRDALFLDMGSTTTDILVLRDGKVAAGAFDDHGRLRAGELVYHGYSRTALMAVARSVPFAGTDMPVMNEFFATMADCRRILGTLDPEDDLQPAADNGDKTIEGARRRLARMVGLDAADACDAAWERLSEAFVEAQIRHVHDGVLKVLSRSQLLEDAPVVIAGAGRAALSRIASRLDRGTVDFSDLFEGMGEFRPAVCRAAPAAALAILAGR